MKNPLNVFYKKELKQQKVETHKIKKELVPKDIQKQQLLDQSQFVLGSKFSTNLVDQIAEMSFDHKKELND